MMNDSMIARSGTFQIEFWVNVIVIVEQSCFDFSLRYLEGPGTFVDCVKQLFFELFLAIVHW